MNLSYVENQILTAEEIYKKTQLDYADKKIDELSCEWNIPLFSTWAAENRFIPEGITDFPGFFDPDLAPHLIEPLDMLHPDAPCKIVSFMKSGQSFGTTSIAENAMGAWMKYRLGSILYLTSTKKIGEIRGSANIDTMIDYSGLGDCLEPFSNRSNRKQKDSSTYKELKGNMILMLSSYSSIADLKSNPFKLIIKDELDEAAAELKGQGDVEGIIEVRTFATTDYKIFNISTSSDAKTSRINKNFYLGDQREFFAPCPHCGEKQIFGLKQRGQDYGLTFKCESHNDSNRKTLIPETVRYICKFCKEDFHESKKGWCLKNGVWIPQAVPVDKEHLSYRSPGYLSPAMSWKRISQLFVNTGFGEDIPKFKDFTITVLAKAWSIVNKSENWEMLKARSEDYILGTVPEGKLEKINGLDIYTGPMIFFGGVDVHKDRLELCVTGFGFNGEKWIIDYQIFYGSTENIDDISWNSLNDFGYEKLYSVQGHELPISMITIDAGYDPRKSDKREKDFNNKAHIVYEFVAQRTDRFSAIIGSPDEKAIGILKESRISDMNTSLKKRYLVSVSLLKDSIMNVIANTSGFNTIHFPKWQIVEGLKKIIPDDFYQQFLSERYQENPKKPGRFGWFKIRARNEKWDTFIYTIAGAAIFNLSAWSNQMWSDWYFDLVEDFDDD